MRRVDPELSRGPRDRLSVVPGARGDNARLALGRRERRELVHRAADLERAGPLQVLGLQPHRAAAELRERLGRIDRRQAPRSRRCARAPPRSSVSAGAVFSVAKLEHPPKYLPNSRSADRALAAGPRPAADVARDRRAPPAGGAPSRAPTRRRTPRRRDSSAAAPRAAPPTRGGRGAPRSAPTARGRSRRACASVRTIGGRHARSWSSDRIERTSFSIVFAAG